MKVTVKLTDDVDGREAVETVRFSIDGQSYEIDLNEANARSLRESLERYVSAARKARPSVRRTASPAGGERPLGYDAQGRPGVGRGQRRQGLS